PQERGIRRVQPGDRVAERVERVAAERCAEPQADVGLEDVAAPDVADRLADRGPVLLRRRGQPEVAAAVTARLAAAGPGPLRQLPEPALQRVTAAGSRQRLERPSPGGPVT